MPVFSAPLGGPAAPRGRGGPGASPSSGPAAAGGRDPAASMSLLNQLLRNPLDAGYHAYSKDAADARVPAWRKALLLLLAAALGLACTLAVRDLRAPGADAVQQTLLDQARAQMATVQSLDADVTALSAQVRAAAGDAGPDEAALAPGVALAASTTPVDGPGLLVTLDDRRDTGLDSPVADGAVSDQDLRVVLNALWSGGAEALSVNGLRIGPGTFVRTAGSVILVDVTPVQAPYEVAAIGDANDLSIALVRGAAGDYLSTAQSLRGITVRSRSSSSLPMDALDAPVGGRSTTTDSSGG